MGNEQSPHGSVSLDTPIVDSQYNALPAAEVVGYTPLPPDLLDFVGAALQKIPYGPVGDAWSYSANSMYDHKERERLQRNEALHPHVRAVVNNLMRPFRLAVIKSLDAKTEPWGWGPASVDVEVLGGRVEPAEDEHAGLRLPYIQATSTRRRRPLLAYQAVVLGGQLACYCRPYPSAASEPRSVTVDPAALPEGDVTLFPYRAVVVTNERTPYKIVPPEAGHADDAVTRLVLRARYRPYIV